MDSVYLPDKRGAARIPPRAAPPGPGGPPGPELLDVCSGRGGAARGYQLAGFRVTGVDLEPQPGYAGDSFIQGDALEVLADADFVARFQAIHISPPCQRWTVLPLTAEQRARHPDLITPARPLLEATGLPYVMENIWRRAPLRGPVLYCGAAMGLRVIVHRGFEANWPLMSPGCACPANATTARGFINRRHRGPLAPGRTAPTRDESAWLEAAGLAWLPGQSARDAIPPAYTHDVGGQLRSYLAAMRESEARSQN